MSSLCREFGVSRKTGYRWLHRYRSGTSLRDLSERSRRPHHSPNRTASELEDRVVDLRQCYDWGARKLQVLLEREGVYLSESTINRILKRRGLVSPSRSHRPASRRFERQYCNELWQMDFKGDYRLEMGRCYPLSILDDHSRFSLGLYALDHLDTPSVQKCLIRTFQRYGVPEAILMDHGVPWWGNANANGLTRLSVSLLKQDIRLCFSGVRHPQTQGKVERFNRTLSEKVRKHEIPKTIPAFQRLLSRFRDEYNRIRPHEALDMDVPENRYTASLRAYNPEPRKWEYPEGSTLKQLNPQGCLDYKGKRLFVSEALAGEAVRLERIDETLIVQYRNMYVREINLNTRKSASLLKPTNKHGL
jgi:transposase InsO family protein